MKKELFFQGQIVTVSKSGWDDVPDGTKGEVVVKSNEGFIVEILEGESKGVNMLFQGHELTSEALHVVTLRLPAALIKELDRIVVEEGHSSRSELVRQLLGFSLSGKTFDMAKIEKARNDLTELLQSQIGTHNKHSEAHTCVKHSGGKGK